MWRVRSFVNYPGTGAAAPDTPPPPCPRGVTVRRDSGSGLRTPSIADTATGDLHLTAPASINGTPTNCAAVLHQPLSTTIPAGGVGVLSVDVIAFAAGAFSVPVMVESDDANEASYTFTITGTATALTPVLFSHLKVDFGNVPVNTVTRRRVAVTNQGTQAVSISTISLSAPSGGYAYVSSNPVGVVPSLPAAGVAIVPGDTIELLFDFAAGSLPGITKNATLTFTSNSGGTAGTQTIVLLTAQSVSRPDVGENKDENCSTSESPGITWLALLAALAALATASAMRRRA